MKRVLRLLTLPATCLTLVFLYGPALAEDEDLWSPAQLSLPELGGDQSKRDISRQEPAADDATPAKRAARRAPADLNRQVAPPGLERELALQGARYLAETGSPFNAAAHLLAAAQQGKVNAREDPAASLLVGWYQELGLYHRAGALASELGSGWRAEQHNRIWLAQARAWLRRGYAREAERALRELRTPLDPDVEEARQSLLALSLLRQQRYAAAMKELEDKKGLPRNSVYDRYNLGVALVGLGRTAEGLGLLDELGQIPAEDEALLALRDRANLVLGWVWLAADEGGTARPFFKRVRQDGLHANMALLGLGWAELAPDGVAQERIYTRKQVCNEDQLARLPPTSFLRRPVRDDCNLDKPHVFKYRDKFGFEPGTNGVERFREALKPWQVLRKRKARDPAVQEGLLATGYALARLGAHGQARTAYQQAIKRYEEELKRLASLEKTLKSQSDPLVALDKKAYRDEYSEWRSSQAFSAAVTDFETLQRCASELEKSRARLERLRPSTATQRERLNQLLAQWTQQREIVATTTAALRAALKRKSLEQIADQRTRLESYLTHARLALAALYEQGGSS